MMAERRDSAKVHAEQAEFFRAVNSLAAGYPPVIPLGAMANYWVSQAKTMSPEHAMWIAKVWKDAAAVIEHSITSPVQVSKRVN